jgi:hypothetical protein
LIAGAVAVGAFAFAFVAFVGTGPQDHQSPATSDAASEITIEGTAGDLSATWSQGGQSWAGVPVDVVVPDETAPVENPDPPSESWAKLVGLKAFSIDTTSLDQASLDPIPITADAPIGSSPSALLLAFAPRDAEGSATGTKWDRSMTALFPTPTDMNVLDPGQYRVVVVGRTSEGALFQFAFAVDVTSTPPSLSDSANAADISGAGIGPDLAGGSDVTLTQARNMTNLPMLLPETSLANDSNIAHVWVRTGSDYVLVEYSSGINVEIRPWPVADIAPDDHWKRLMNEGIPGQIVNVGGQDAFVVPSSETAKGSASFVVNQTFVSIIGNGTQSEDDLVALMQSAMSSARAG